MSVRYTFREEDLVDGTAPDFASAFESYVTVSGCGVSRLERNTGNDYLLVCAYFPTMICKKVDPGCRSSGSYSRTEGGMSAFVQMD